ncbi:MULTISPECIES: hypothetical protein [unclassified Microcoleus]|uniref:hypothetical protein n=1 Tax=unclassified Microcoleus TaxID=2642155 RepID=UPI002FD68305
MKILQQILPVFGIAFVKRWFAEQSGNKPQRQALRLWRGVSGEAASYKQIIVPLLETHFHFEKGVVR